MNPRKKVQQSTSNAEIKAGLFSKEEASEFLFLGHRHIHSTMLQLADPLVQQTMQKQMGEHTCYNWEVAEQNNNIALSESSRKRAVIEILTAHTQFANQTQNRDKLETVLEELLTNSLYHSQRDSSGQDIFNRTEAVVFSQEKAVSVQFGETSAGIHLLVCDSGGSLRFEDFSVRLNRFFSQDHPHFSLEQKQSGAGLGLSLVFQLATHTHISVVRGKRTSISVWLSKNKYQDPDFFSFNFFEE